MKITVYRKHEIEISFDEMLEMKENYNENPDSYYNFDDILEFINFLEENYDYTDCDDFIVEEKDYKKFLEKWNKM